MKERVDGVCAALLFARDANGKLDEESFARQLEFLLVRGIRNFAMNGATGEYCITTHEDLRRSLQIARSVLPSDARLLCGIGAASFSNSLALAKICFEAGVSAALVPMPYFFPYDQDDLFEFVRRLDEELAVPILLYNLPRFTSGLDANTVVALARECANVIGIKDSSGSLTILRNLTLSRVAGSRIVGSDGTLAEALIEGVCDGVISGVACVVPEIIQAIFAHSPGSPEFNAASAHLSEFVSKIDVLPGPWGLKVVAELRGISPATYALPISSRRASQINQLQSWFEGWAHSVLEV